MEELKTKLLGAFKPLGLEAKLFVEGPKEKPNKIVLKLKPKGFLVKRLGKFWIRKIKD